MRRRVGKVTVETFDDSDEVVLAIWRIASPNEGESSIASAILSAEEWAELTKLEKEPKKKAKGK